MEGQSELMLSVNPQLGRTGRLPSMHARDGDKWVGGDQSLQLGFPIKSLSILVVALGLPIIALC